MHDENFPLSMIQEAVLDFEEMLESSREKHPTQQRSDTLPPSFPPSLDLLHHTTPAKSGVREPGRGGVTVTRSHSLPRTCKKNICFLHLLTKESSEYDDALLNVFLCSVSLRKTFYS